MMTMAPSRDHPPPTNVSSNTFLSKIWRRNPSSSTITSTVRHSGLQEHTTLPATSMRMDIVPNPHLSTRPQPTPRPESPKFQWVRGELLGKGSFGKVYLALNATTGDIMAVKQVEQPKTINGPDKHQQEIIEALKFESNTLKDLDHPHIVHYLGWEEGPENLCIFMEYVSGGTISSCLQSHGPFRDDITRSFTTQILGGLEYLHSRGIIHRDLKADNILVESGGTCKISDFGISKQAADEGRAFTGMRGTVYWMAPEVLDLDKKNGYDAKIDIWSIGCVVLEMWSGVRPWSGLGIFPVMMKLAKEKLPPPIPKNVQVSEVGLDFRKKCFAVDPKIRPSAAELIRHPYLKLPEDWLFPGFDKDSPMQNMFESAPTVRPPTTVKGVGRSRRQTKNLPAVPPVPTTAPPDHSDPTLTQAHYNAVASSSKPELPLEGPPIVFITPLRSPAQSNSNPTWSPEETPSPSTSNSSTKWSARRRKSFYVVNPDQEEDPSLQRRKYIYSPPPLPSTSMSSRLSMHPDPRRVSSSLSLVKQAVPRRAPSTPALRSSYVTSSYGTNTGNYTDSDSDSEIGTSLWKRPPAMTLTDTHEEMSDKEKRRASRISRVGSKRDSAWARPLAEDIYQNMGQCFPGHDIDKRVIQDGIPSEPTRGASIKRGQKSIRMVAEERFNDPARARKRGTKLWGSRLEEISKD